MLLASRLNFIALLFRKTTNMGIYYTVCEMTHLAKFQHITGERMHWECLQDKNKK